MTDETAGDFEGDGLFDRTWRVPWHAHVVPLAIGVLLLSSHFLGGDALAAAWAVSWRSIGNGQALPIALHMLVHGSVLHLLVNLVAFLFLSAPLISRLGRPPLSWARYLYLLVGSGASGAALFLLLNRGSAASVIGISGAVFGMVAALARVHPTTGEPVGVRSGRTWLLAKFFIQNHVALFLFLAIIALASGRWVGLAWEAHLGGLLFGFFAMPLYLERSAD